MVRKVPLYLLDRAELDLSLTMSGLTLGQEGALVLAGQCGAGLVTHCPCTCGGCCECHSVHHSHYDKHHLT